METTRIANIMGVDYTVEVLKYDEHEYFEKDEIAGWQDSELKQIVVLDMSTHPVYKIDKASEEKCEIKQKQVLRHEIIHAFMYESGLDTNALALGSPWATNEEMIDWFAIQSPKIFKVYQELGCM